MRYSLDCQICPHTQAPEPEETELRVMEGDHWVATLRADDQEYLGTTYISLREHKESLIDLSRDQEDEFVVIRNKIITAQQKAFNAAVTNVSCLMNLAFQDELPSPHVHYHLKPRYEHPIKFDGHLFIDRQFGSYIKDKYPHPVSRAMGVAITKRLQAEITT